MYVEISLPWVPIIEKETKNNVPIKIEKKGRKLICQVPMKKKTIFFDARKFMVLIIILIAF